MSEIMSDYCEHYNKIRPNNRLSQDSESTETLSSEDELNENAGCIKNEKLNVNGCLSAAEISDDSNSTETLPSQDELGDTTRRSDTSPSKPGILRAAFGDTLMDVLIDSGNDLMSSLDDNADNLVDVLLESSQAEVTTDGDKIEWLCTILGCTVQDAARALHDAGGDMTEAMLHVEQQVKDKAVSAQPMTNCRDPYQLSLLTWNVDGYNTLGVTERFSAVISTVKNLNPDVVFLQEITAMHISRIEESFGKAFRVLWGRKNIAYFNVVLLRKNSELIFEEKEVTDFAQSQMGRHAINVTCRRAGRCFHLITSHIESLKDSRDERRRQIINIFDEMRSYDSDDIAIFGGDTNLRGIDNVTPPPVIKDCWIECGSNPEEKYTWDTKVNHNLCLPYSARLRFDRVYYREAPSFKVNNFKLVGKNKLLSCELYPSDHWGIFVTFTVS